MAFGTNCESVRGSDGTQGEGWSVAISRLAESLRNRAPIGPLPSLRQRVVFYLQSPAGADTKMIRKLSGLRESGRTQHFVFVLAIPAPFVFDSELDSSDHPAFELNFPNV